MAGWWGWPLGPTAEALGCLKEMGNADERQTISVQDHLRKYTVATMTAKVKVCRRVYTIAVVNI